MNITRSNTYFHVNYILDFTINVVTNIHPNSISVGDLFTKLQSLPHHIVLGHDPLPPLVAPLVPPHVPPGADGVHRHGVQAQPDFALGVDIVEEVADIGLRERHHSLAGFPFRSGCPFITAPQPARKTVITICIHSFLNYLTRDFLSNVQAMYLDICPLPVNESQHLRVLHGDDLAPFVLRHQHREPRGLALLLGELQFRAMITSW